MDPCTLLIMKMVSQVQAEGSDEIATLMKEVVLSYETSVHIHQILNDRVAIYYIYIMDKQVLTHRYSKNGQCIQ